MTAENTAPQVYASGNSKTSFDLEPNPFEQSFASKDPAAVGDKPNTAAGTTSPQILTPGGRKLPPLVLSPNVSSSWGTTQFPRTGLTPNDSNMRTGLTPGGANYPHSLNNMSMTGVGTPGSLGFTAFTPGLSSLLGTNTKEFDQQVQATHATANTIPVITTDPPPPQNPSEQLSAITSNGSSAIQSPGTMVIREKKTTKQPAKRARKAGSSSKRTGDQPETKRKKKSVKNEEEEVEEELDEPTVDESNMTEEEKRRSFLERNRVAASKCRKRKKEQTMKMESDLNFYLNEYNNLTAALDQLKEQSLVLHQYILQGKPSAQLLPEVETLLSTINRTNYIARLRGDNPSNIIPTVQPINPNLVQQTQQRIGQAIQGKGLSNRVGVGVVPMHHGVPMDPSMAGTMHAQQQQPQMIVANGNGKVPRMENMGQWAA